MALSLGGSASAQTGSPPTAAGPPTPTPSPFHLIPLPPQAAIKPGQLTLIGLEGRFADDVAKGGGKAFSAWFAENSVALSNGQPALRGRAAIQSSATWDPKDYLLTWVAEGAEMGPSNDMGYTWGHYEGRSKDKGGKTVVKSGRYITVWKKQPDGQWKVALDASADGPPTGVNGVP